jgi:hypothetical protein
MPDRDFKPVNTSIFTWGNWRWWWAMMALWWDFKGLAIRAAAAAGIARDISFAGGTTGHGDIAGTQ